jgi:hypothetical protein
MGTLSEITSNLLRFSKGDVSLYEKTTSSFEQKIGSPRPSDNAAPARESSAGAGNANSAATPK